MKRIIVTEKQAKLIIDSLITEQASAGQKQGLDSWYLCGYDIVSQNGRYYAEVEDNSFIELPVISDLRGVVQNGTLVFNERVQNGLELGMVMKRGAACMRKMPMQYAGASVDGENGSWFVYVNNEDREGPVPVYSIMTWDGSLRTQNFPYMEMKKDKNGTEVIFAETRTKRFIIEISPAMKGGRYTIQEPNKIPPPVRTPEYEEIKLDIQSPFEFDKVTLTPEAETQFKVFVEKVKANYQGVSGDVEVICSASIDADENAKRDYNQKLSENRAATIANRLKTETGITTLNFIPKGIGQTDQFAKGMKYPDVRDTAKTAPNRRLIINMPTLKREKK